MSILKSVHAGHKYIKWKEDLDKFAEGVLRNSGGWDPNSPDYIKTFRDVRYYVPKRRKNRTDAYECMSEEWFRYLTTWTIDEFKNAILEEIKNKLSKQNNVFEIEDVVFPDTAYIRYTI